MSMSKRDFVALADALRPMFSPHEESAENVAKYRVVDALVGFMRGQNPRFNESRWRAFLAGECGPSGGKIKKEAR